MAGAPEQWPLVGRGEELAMLDEQIAAAGRSMVVAGAVGVGKSRLLAGWVVRIEASGRPAAVVQATRSTATIPFGAFARWIPERLGDTSDRLGVLRATAARLAERGSELVVAVDDAHLLDDGSAALVLHLVQTDRARVLVAVRSGEPCPDGIVSLWKERLAVRLDVQPLSEPQTVELVGRVLGGDLTTTARGRLWQLTEGNPLYLREVVDAALAQGVLARSPTGWHWQGALAGRERLVGLVSDRITTSDGDERRALEVLALGEPLPADVLGRVVPGEVLTRLERRGLIIGGQPSGRPADPNRPVRLVHPLYSEVLRAELPPFTVQSHHRALADAAVAAGVHNRDPLRVATWMLDGGDHQEPHLLLRAAFLAQVVGDNDLGARLAEAAERAGAGWRATLRRAEALGARGRWDEATALLSSLSTPSAEPEAQAAAARLQADLSYWYRGEDLSVARAILDEAADRIPAPARAMVRTQRASVALVALDLQNAIELATAALNDASRPAERLSALGCALYAAVLLGRTTVARRGVELATPHALAIAQSEPGSGTMLAFAYQHALVLGGRIDHAAAMFEVLLEQDVVGIGGTARALPELWLARARLAQGRVASAMELARDALRLLGDDNHYGTGTLAATILATAAAQSGDPSAATEGNDAVAWIDAHPRARAEPEASLTDLARAWVAGTHGDASAARRLATDVAARARAAGAWTVELLALLDLTRLGGARAAAARLASLADLVEGSYSVAAAELARAAAAHDGPALDAVAHRYEAMDARLLGAEAAVLAAEAHGGGGRRRSHTASVATARRLAAACEGASTPVLARLHDQPLAAALTDREREVTDLAARGRTSREIAEALAISVRTVDSHLNHAYTKLGVTNRRDLATALGRP